MASRIGAHDVVATRRIEFTAVGPDGWGAEGIRRHSTSIYCTVIAQRLPIASLSGQGSG